MQITKECEKTNLRVIPQDWDLKKVGEFADVTAGGTPSTFNSTYWNGNIRWMNSGELNLKKIFEVDGRITESGLKNSSTQMLPSKCVLIGLAGQGKTRGTVAINYVKLCTNQSICAVIPNDSFIPEYLYHNLDSRYNELRKLSTGEGGRGGLNLTIIRNIEVPLPTKEEQSAITQVLSDTDALIESLDRLIEKKKNIKQGAMQELLSGKKRLSGWEFNKFQSTDVGIIPADWKVENILENSTLKARIGWQGLTTAEYLDSGNFQLVTGTDFKKGKIAWETCVFVDYKRYAQDRNIQLKIGDILVTKDGTIGKVAYVNALHLPATLNSGVFVIRPKERAYFPLFLYYILTSAYFTRFLNKLAAGSTINHLYQKDFSSFNFIVPAYAEQEEIAKAFFAMDLEIEALEQKRDKYKQLKVGLMQQLLTGRIRLKCKN